jgi:hypothetical protein
VGEGKEEEYPELPAVITGILSFRFQLAKTAKTVCKISKDGGSAAK